MSVPQKWQYALRAILELAQRQEFGEPAVADLAAGQAIPAPFLDMYCI